MNLTGKKMNKKNEILTVAHLPSHFFRQLADISFPPVKVALVMCVHTMHSYQGWLLMVVANRLVMGHQFAGQSITNQQKNQT